MRALPALLLLAACGVPPEAPPARADAAGSAWPRIVPLEGLAEAAPARAVDPSLGARAGRLRARATALGGPVLDAGTRARLGETPSR